MQALPRFLSLPVVFALLVSAQGCGGEEKKPVKAPVATQPAATLSSGESSAPKADAAMAVKVDDQILKQCNLKIGPVEGAPKFDFDSDALTQPERDILEGIAKCLTTGPLKGRSVDLVGRADPRGEQEYNMSLGARRARAVHGFMTQLGVPGDKLHETSRGELDASGTDESGWRLDRRVDVKLAP